jgi:hypothetical protein
LHGVEPDWWDEARVVLGSSVEGAPQCGAQRCCWLEAGNSGSRSVEGDVKNVVQVDGERIENFH